MLFFFLPVPTKLLLEMMRTYKQMEVFHKSINSHNHIIRRIFSTAEFLRDTLEFDIVSQSTLSFCDLCQK